MCVSTALFVEMKTPVNCCLVVRIICAHNHDKRMASPPERLHTTAKNVFINTKNRGCSLIRACSLIRSNTVCVCRIINCCLRYYLLKVLTFYIIWMLNNYKLTIVADFRHVQAVSLIKWLLDLDRIRVG